jgi:hypothetical protein
MDRCEECGFVYDRVEVGDIPAALRALGPRWRQRLASAPDEALRRRPAPEVWSPLEYACHLRDVLRVQHERLRLALARPTPEFAPMGREELVVRDRYNQQDPATVAAELTGAATALARAFAALDAEGWARTGIYNYPRRQERSMAWLGRHTIHEGEHHLLDVDRGLAAS